MKDWIEIGNIEDIPRLGARVVQTPSGDIAVFRTADDQIFAIEDRCPHRGGPLSQGMVHGGKVTCPLHNWAIDLANGEAVAPDQGCAEKYKVNIEDGAISLYLDMEPRLEAISA